jgi:hypothetical protein
MGKKKRKSESADLLEELATLDEVEAILPDDMDHTREAVPKWCELVLRVKRIGEYPIGISMPLRRHDGELIMQVLHDVLHPARESSSGKQIWREFDDAVDRIQARVLRGKDPRPADVGEARAYATALAILGRPMDPDPDAVRDVAMVRWETRNRL